MRKNEVNGVVLSDRDTLYKLIAAKQLYDLETVAEIAGYCVRYLRRLCHEGKIDHHKLLGRYYMTPAEVTALLQPVKAKAAK